MFRMIVEAIKSWWHYLSPDRCRFYEEQLMAISRRCRVEIPQAVAGCVRKGDNDDTVYVLAWNFDLIQKMADREYKS